MGGFTSLPYPYALLLALGAASAEAGRNRFGDRLINPIHDATTIRPKPESGRGRIECHREQCGAGCIGHANTAPGLRRVAAVSASAGLAKPIAWRSAKAAAKRDEAALSGVPEPPDLNFQPPSLTTVNFPEARARRFPLCCPRAPSRSACLAIHRRAARHLGPLGMGEIHPGRLQPSNVDPFEVWPSIPRPRALPASYRRPAEPPFRPALSTPSRCAGLHSGGRSLRAFVSARAVNQSVISAEPRSSRSPSSRSRI